MAFSISHPCFSAGCKKPVDFKYKKLIAHSLSIADCRGGNVAILFFPLWFAEEAKLRCVFNPRQAETAVQTWTIELYLKSHFEIAPCWQKLALLLFNVVPIIKFNFDYHMSYFIE